MRKSLVLAIVFSASILILTQALFSDSNECVWISFDGTPDFTATDVEVIESNPSETVLRITVHGMCIEDAVIGSDTYQVITVPEMTTTYEFGKPQLPAVGELLALSTHADSIAVTYVSTSTPDTFENVNCFPLQPGAACGWQPGFSIDSTFYDENDAFYPEDVAEGDSTNLWHVLPVGHVSIFPFRYNPVTDLLIAYDTVYVTLNHPGLPVTDKIPRSYNTMYETLINYNTLAGTLDFNTMNNKPLAGFFDIDSTNYMPHKLFIVADSLIDDPNLDRLIEYEKKKGFKTSKMNVSDAGGSPPDPYEIKNTIKTYYSNPERASHPIYVVLVGDHDQVPARVAPFPHPGVSQDTLVLSDQWYEFMGPEGADFMPDLMVGRLPTNESNTLAVMIGTKIKNDTTASANVTKLLFVADRDTCTGLFDLGNGTMFQGWYHMENKKLIKSMVVRPMMCGFQVTEVYGPNGGTNAAVKTAIESGLGYVNYRGHGTTTSWLNWDFNDVSWTKADVSGLNITDTEPIVWSICCSNNAIDDSEDCIGEEWVKKGKATAHFASSRKSPADINQYLDYDIHWALCYYKRRSETTDLGHVISLAKIKLISSFNPTTKGKGYSTQLALLEYLLLGDPEQTVWTEPASGADVAHNSSFSTGSSSTTITVESEGDPVSGAIACLLKEGSGGDEVFQAKYTNHMGEASFDINPKTPGTMRVTVWGQNLELYSADVPVVPGGWRDGDDHKMHFPQLPDTFGLDVDFAYPNVLADDWRCSQSGPVSDIHFWFSARGDWFDPYEDLPGQISNIHVSIHANIPDPDGGGQLYSMPGETLWTGDFAPDSSIVTFCEYASGDQGWYNPNTLEYISNDHVNVYQCNIEGIPDPFIQELDSIYWLDLSITMNGSVGPDSLLGWKTSNLDRYPPPHTGEHYEDDAVWGEMTEPMWDELRYPDGPRVGQSLDLAFVIAGDSDITGVADDPGVTPRSHKLRQNYPNPFNPTTTIQYELPKREHVYLAIYNARGQRVRILVDGQKPAGRHEIGWDGRDTSGVAVASGVYFYYMKAGGFAQAKKLVFLK